jgi:hypothetical protein
MGLDAALDRFWEVAETRRLGIDSIQVVADDGRHGERRRIADIRRDVFSISKTVTAGNAYRWADDDADHPGDPARDLLGIRNPQWLRCPLGAVGLQLRTSEITLLAQLLLHEGVHDLHVWRYAGDGGWQEDPIQTLPQSALTLRSTIRPEPTTKEGA